MDFRICGFRAMGCWLFILLLAPLPILAQSLEERLLSDAIASNEDKFDILVYFEPLRAFGIDGTHYQFFTLTDESKCSRSENIFESIGSDSLNDAKKCGIRQVDQIFIEGDLGLTAGIHSRATILAESGMGVFFFRSSQMKYGLVLYNESISALSPLDVLTAISVGLETDPEKMQIGLDRFSFHRQPWEKPISFVEFAAWSSSQPGTSGFEGLSEVGSACEGEAGPQSSGCQNCSHGGPGASSCSCPGNGCTVSCFTGHFACCRCGLINPTGCFCCSVDNGGPGDGWNWPPPFWPPFPPPMPPPPDDPT